MVSVNSLVRRSDLLDYNLENLRSSSEFAREKERLLLARDTDIALAKLAITDKAAEREARRVLQTDIQIYLYIQIYRYIQGTPSPLGDNRIPSRQKSTLRAKPT